MTPALSAFLAAHAVAAVAGVCLYSLLEYLLPRTRAVKARSVIEGVINVLGAALHSVPWLGDVMLRLGSPQVPTLEQTLASSALEDVTPTKPVKLPAPPLILLALILPALVGCAVKPQVIVRDSIASAAKMVQAGLTVAHEGAKGCAAKAAKLADRSAAQLALDSCKASWARDLMVVDAANSVVLDASIAVPAFDAGATAVNGKTTAEWVAALVAAATAAAKIADLPPVKGL